jgi:RNA polymerase sigma factor (sigma-70 family)
MAAPDDRLIEIDADPIDLARRLHTGDADAVRSLYRLHGSAALAVARRILDSRALAEEAVQNAFLSIWNARDRIDPVRDPAPWVFTFVKRASIDLLRRERLRTHSSIDAAGEHPALRTDPEYERATDVWAVRKAVDDLPPDEREVVRLSHFDGFTHQEIAARLGVAVGTVKSRSHRAHRRLVESLRSSQEVAP